MIRKCTNCGSHKTEKLNEINTQGTKAVMSDGSFADNFHALQSLCQQCGSIIINYSPPDRLKKYFSEEYNVSDEIQNCQVVVSGIKRNKHSVIHRELLDFCSNIPPTGNFLEIACGNGLLSNKFSQEHPEWECIALDPSIDAGTLVSTKVKFIRDFFDPLLFKGEKFDVVIAHGILNRTPTLKMLESITSLANKNARISIEIVTLENSIFAPHIWDHSYTFLEETFLAYLTLHGICVKKRVDCGSTIQFLCEYQGINSQKLSIQESTIQSTYLLYRNHLKRWEEIKTRFFENLTLCKKEKITLFGAGLYNAVLLSLIGKNHIDVVIDEIRQGNFVEDVHIISLEKAMKIKLKNPVFLCTRPKNLNYIKSKLLARGFKVVSLLN